MIPDMNNLEGIGPTGCADGFANCHDNQIATFDGALIHEYCFSISEHHVAVWLAAWHQHGVNVAE